MGERVYINLCRSGDFHAGIVRADGTRGAVRTAEPRTIEALRSYAEVILNDGVLMTPENVGNAIMEVFNSQRLEHNIPYEFSVTDGNVKLMLTAGFDTSNEIRECLRFAILAGCRKLMDQTQQTGNAAIRGG